MGYLPEEVDGRLVEGDPDWREDHKVQEDPEEAVPYISYVLPYLPFYFCKVGYHTCQRK